MAEISYVGTAVTPTNAAEVTTLNKHLQNVSESFAIEPGAIKLDTYNGTTEINFIVEVDSKKVPVEVTPR